MTLAAGNGTALWYITRASGVVSLVLLTAGLVLGVLGTVRWKNDRWPRFAVVSIHRNVTLFAIAFVAIHVLTAIADGYAPVGFKDAVIPFVSRYRPLWLGFGAGAFDLLLVASAGSEHTASAASRDQPPTNTASRRRSDRSSPERSS